MNLLNSLLITDIHPEAKLYGRNKKKKLFWTSLTMPIVNIILIIAKTQLHYHATL